MIWSKLDSEQKGYHKSVTRNQIYVSYISISDFNKYFTGLSRGIYTMIEVIGSTVFRCFFAVEPVSVHNLVVGHKIGYCKYRTCFDLSKGCIKVA